MRRLTAWIGGVAGGVVAYRFWRRRSEATPEPTPPEPAPAEPDARADELRAKLAETRIDESAQVAEEEPTVEPESPEDRRQRVHEEGRATLDEMKSDENGAA